ncbi:MAG: tryptophan-rich sensory protein [Ruminococcaceae bacterium]|nr:tryptophan-rich sensory protein [Oscillospiraceae bacterium]
MGNTFKVVNARNIIRFVILVLIPLAVGALAGFLTQNSREFYAALQKPFLSPPGFLFPIIWTVLYILIGIASYLVYKQGVSKPYVRDALKFYAISLLFSFIWPLVFFRFQFLFGAFWVLLLLWLFTGIAAAKFYRINHWAGYLMLPYWLWITFAGYLNLAVWLLNR